MKKPLETLSNRVEADWWFFNNHVRLQRRRRRQQHRLLICSRFSLKFRNLLQPRRAAESIKTCNLLNVEFSTPDPLPDFSSSLRVGKLLHSPRLREKLNFGENFSRSLKLYTNYSFSTSIPPHFGQGKSRPQNFKICNKPNKLYLPCSLINFETNCTIWRRSRVWVSSTHPFS